MELEIFLFVRVCVTNPCIFAIGEAKTRRGEAVFRRKEGITRARELKFHVKN